MKARPARTSMREIAQETNLSITTVSRVLRERGEISEATRSKVLQAAKRLRYRPNMLVQGIQTGKTHTMGVMVPPYDSYWTQVLHGIHDELSSANHVFINAWCHYASDNDSYNTILLSQLHKLIDRRVDGIILWAHLAPLYNEALVQELEAHNLPVITIDHELPFADSVETNEEQVASLVCAHLTELGHKNTAHLAWDQSYKWAQLRKTYFEEAIARAGGKCVTLATENDEDVPGLTLRLLSENPDVTAIFACSDRVAKLLYSTLQEKGIRVPEDISVVGCADLEFAQWMCPGLTTVRQDGFQTGRSAARLLLDRSSGKIQGQLPTRLKVQCELVVRGSTAKAG